MSGLDNWRYHSKLYKESLVNLWTDIEKVGLLTKGLVILGHNGQRAPLHGHIACRYSYHS